MTLTTTNRPADLHHIVYTSVASNSLPIADLDELVRKARDFNSANSITGILIYSDQVFVQVLEGSKSAVQQLYDRIERDSRHHSVVALENSPLENRRFTDWSMGFDCPTANSDLGTELRNGEALEQVLETEKGQKFVLLMQDLQSNS